MLSYTKFLIILAVAAAAPISGDSATNNSSEFIRRSCAATLYPDLCCSSLAPYGRAVQQSPAKLAVAAANASLSTIKAASSRAAALRRSSGGRLGAALRDCVDSLGTAAEQTRRSVAEMEKLGSPVVAGGPAAEAWRVSNAQTWMSAALTNEETCLDGFDGGLPAAKAVLDGVRRAKMYTSNALALLNVFAHGR
ncbi:21 kDa protein [Apostasia shenzhenica]|uniref:21 kDa protein n=1 Tax=Apostasia shenzhenica TaxID=1088818 RepID=A0A2I0A346_9ASPA|nr:21 kDa protein [Apostasia shenzhenica]